MGKKTNKEKRERKVKESAMAEESQAVRRSSTVYYCIIAGLLLLVFLEVFGVV
ncbi:hypothetical protein [Desulfoplanes sp.]